ncbi:hypothetical protein EPA93_24345 [Ktedonosporobacter rubrisoli]|uniref:Uncharacterized protein n=1 Tax=Ktedonosporobacter rubrisoli TaxID=2509675 RepID=A0A4P6JUH5_KTERU|nr:hypothetical protein [Ktedonosporobacter rubrisoli]QBD78942.1 hypothetical protein EPA93_24345 [Ktedonosporobacter rubrisoli]
MQKLYLRESRTLTLPLKQDDENILHFSLQGALPEGHTLAVNIPFGTCSYLASDNGRPLLLMQEQFTGSEMSVLLPLLESFPYYCPYEVMFARFYNGNVSERVVERCRRHLQEAQEAGLWDQEMRPVRSALSRTRIKLRPFGIDVSSILATGYILMLAAIPAGVND